MFTDSTVFFRVLALWGVATLFVSACAVPLAPFYDEPLPKNGLLQLEAGASREEVVHLLGTPHASRLGGKFWYYGGTRPVVGLFGPDGGGAILDYNWIEVAFDDESRLRYVEHHESKDGCARSNNCLLWGAWAAEAMTGEAIITSPPDHDTTAKMFTPPMNGCAVYLFYSSRGARIARALLLDETIAIGVGSAEPGWLNIDTYIRVEVPQGIVEISAGPAAELLVSRMQWRCEPDSVGYFLVRGSFAGSDRIEEVDAAIGQKQITKRRLVLPP